MNLPRYSVVQIQNSSIHDGVAGREALEFARTIDLVQNDLASALTVQNYNYIRSSSYIDTERIVYTVGTPYATR